MKLSNYCLLLLSLLSLSACNSIGDLWLGSENKAKLPGERLPVMATNSNMNVDEEYKLEKIQVFPEETIYRVDKSIGVDSTRHPNLKLEQDLKQSKVFDFNASKVFASITPPIIAQDRIIILETTGTVVAYDIANGKKLWSSPAFSKKENSGFVSFSPAFYAGGIAVYSDVVYVTAGTNDVVAIDINSGNILWNKSITSPTRSTPVILNNMLFIQGVNNSTYALDIKDGSVIWWHVGVKGEMSMISTITPAINGNTLIVQYNTGTLVGLNAATGEEIWTFEITSEVERYSIQRKVYNVIPKILVDGFSVIAYGNDGIIGVFNLQNGQPYWKKDLGISKPAWVYGELIIAISANDDLVAINKHDGRIKWVTNLNSLNIDPKKHKEQGLWTEPMVANNKVIAVNSLGKLFEFDITTGAKLGQIDIIEDVYTAPIIVQDKMYLVSNKGKIVEYK